MILFSNSCSWSVRTPVRAFGLCLVCASVPVTAQSAPGDSTRAAARELGIQAIEAYQAGDYAAANKNLDKAFRIFATPTLGLWSARARKQLGRWVEAAERYREALRAPVSVGDSDTQREAHDEATSELEALLPRLPVLTVELLDAEPASVALELDGKSVSSDLFGVPLPIDPGTHHILVTRNAERAEVQVRLAERERKLVPLRLSPVTAPSVQVEARQPSVVESANISPLASAEAQRDERSNIVRPLALVGVAVGGAGLATAAITALVANGECSGGRCENQAHRSTYDSLRTASSVAFWAGAACAVGGVVAWFVSPQSNAEHDGNLSWGVSPFGVQVRGSL